jgi:hypothetical protein
VQPSVTSIQSVSKGGAEVEQFICPRCGQESRFDPMVGPACCPACGYTPPQSERLVWQSPSHPARPREQARLLPLALDSRQSLLEELLSHWEGTHVPDPTFRPPIHLWGQPFFDDYQRALSQSSQPSAGEQAPFTLRYQPELHEISWFAQGYALLRRGERSAAAQQFLDLTNLSPRFADAWIWLAATADDPTERIDDLGQALLLEPDHPLAREALAVARGQESPSEGADPGAQPEMAHLARCPSCGVAVCCPQTTMFRCPYCGHQWEALDAYLIAEEIAEANGSLLQPAAPLRPWADFQRMVRCPACTTAVVGSHMSADVCVLCGSANLQIEYVRAAWSEPDRLLRFEISEEQATAAVVAAADPAQWPAAAPGQKALRLRALYLPFWILEGVVEVRWWIRAVADGADAPTQAGAGTSEELPPRVDLVRCQDVLLPATRVPAPRMLEQILPFFPEAMVAYDPARVADRPVALPQVEVGLAAQGFSQSMVSGIRPQADLRVPLLAPGQVLARRTFRVSSASYQLALFPAWVGLLRTGRAHSLALVNGQTGRAAVGPALPGL